MKRCTKCHIEKDESEFYKYKNTYKGKTRIYSHPYCKSCHYIENRKNVIPEKQKAYYKAWRIKNKDKVYKRNKNYRSENIEKFREWDRQYYKNNTEKRKAAVKAWCIKWGREHGKKYNNTGKYRKQEYEYNLNGRINLADWYIVSQLMQRGLAKEIIKQYPELIELKRLEIKTKRVIKN